MNQVFILFFIPECFPLQILHVFLSDVLSEFTDGSLKDSTEASNPTTEDTEVIDLTQEEEEDPWANDNELIELPPPRKRKADPLPMPKNAAKRKSIFQGFSTKIRPLNDFERSLFGDSDEDDVFALLPTPDSPKPASSEQQQKPEIDSAEEKKPSLFQLRKKKRPIPSKNSTSKQNDPQSAVAPKQLNSATEEEPIKPGKEEEQDDEAQVRMQQNNNEQEQEEEERDDEELKSMEAEPKLKTTKADVVVKVKTVSMSVGVLRQLFGKRLFMVARNYLRKISALLSKVTYWGSILANCIALERDVAPSQRFYEVVLQTVMGKQSDYSSLLQEYSIPSFSNTGVTCFQNVLAARMSSNAETHLSERMLKQKTHRTLRYNGISSGEAMKMASSLLKGEEYQYEIKEPGKELDPKKKKEWQENEQEKKKTYELEFKRYQKEFKKVKKRDWEKVSSFQRFLLKERDELDGRRFSLLPLCKMSRVFIPMQKNQITHVLSKVNWKYDAFRSEVGARIKGIKQLIRKGWELLPNVLSDGYRITFTVGWKEKRPATEKQLNYSKRRPLYEKKEKKPPKVVPTEITSLDEIEEEFELIGIDPGRDQVMAWVQDGRPRFYSAKQYKNDFGVAAYAKHNVFERWKQRYRWRQKKEPDYFELHTKLSLKQWDKEVMKKNVGELVAIAPMLFEFYQRGTFNRLRFWMYKKRRIGLEKLVAMITKFKKKEKQRSENTRARERYAKKMRRTRLKRKWKPVQRVVTEERKKRDEKREKERKEREEKRKNKGVKTEWRKKEEQKPKEKKRNRVATASRREKRKLKKEEKNRPYKEKSWDFRKPSLNVDSNAFPSPKVATIREFLIAEQLVELQKKKDSVP